MSKTETKETPAAPAAAAKAKPPTETEGFELKPQEVVVTYQDPETDTKVSHIFGRLLNRIDRRQIILEQGKQVTKRNIHFFDGDVDAAFAQAYDHMIVGVSGFTVNGKPARAEDVKVRLNPRRKRRAIEDTEQLKVREADIDFAELGESGDAAAVEIEVLQGASTVTVKHVFDGPLTAKELRTLSNRTVGFRAESRDVIRVQSSGAIDVVEAIYDSKLADVDGYLYEGEPLTPKVNKWLRSIPIDHKLLAIGELRRRVERPDPSS